MKDLAFLEYTFIFESDPDTWSRGTDFEDDLASFFSAHGLEATPFKTVGGTGRRVIYIQRVDKLDKMRDGGATNNTNPRQALDKAMKKAAKAGEGKK